MSRCASLCCWFEAPPTDSARIGVVFTCRMPSLSCRLPQSPSTRHPASTCAILYPRLSASAISVHTHSCIGYFSPLPLGVHLRFPMLSSISDLELLQSVFILTSASSLSVSASAIAWLNNQPAPALRPYSPGDTFLFFCLLRSPCSHATPATSHSIQHIIDSEETRSRARSFVPLHDLNHKQGKSEDLIDTISRVTMDPDEAEQAGPEEYWTQVIRLLQRKEKWRWRLVYRGLNLFVFAKRILQGEQ
jgi:hypothetical protein